MRLKHAVVAITGAGQGIGRHLALEFAKEGAEIAISDVTAERVADTATLVRALGVEPLVMGCDVAKFDEMEGFAAGVADRFGHADVMVNNAGVAMLGTFDEIEIDEFAWLMNINFWGSVHAAKAFLPLLRVTGHEARLALISSVFGFFAPAGNGPYAASKFAVRGFGESLYNELLAGPVGVTLVHPGGISTGIARSARVPRNLSTTSATAQHDRFDTLAETTPQQAARTIVDGIKANRRRILIGNDAKIIDIVSRLLPMRVYELFVSRISPEPTPLIAPAPVSVAPGVVETRTPSAVGI